MVNVCTFSLEHARETREGNTRREEEPSLFLSPLLGASVLEISPFAVLVKKQHGPAISTTRGAIQKSELASWTMAGPLILANETGVFQEVLLENHLL